MILSRADVKRRAGHEPRKNSALESATPLLYSRQTRKGALSPVASQPVEVFFSYSHKDEGLRNELETHLAMLKNEGVISDWHDRQILPGQEWDGQIDEHLNSADIILLLASPDFLASKYCYDIEVARAMERHEEAGDACVIPVILRPCEWQRAPFSKLQALPTGTVPITRWPDRDEAFLKVAEGIRRAVEQLLSSRGERRETSDDTAPPSTPSLIPRPPVIGFVARRDAEGRDIVGRLREELAPGRNQPVTLSGPGGIGKTTLAAEAARELLAAYEGRIVWSSADGRSDFTLLSLLDDISTQLGRADLRTLAPAVKEEQVRALVAEAPALVVPDNYETITDAEKKRIEAWFKTAQCSALFTSRHRISETVFVQVSAMSREEAEEFFKNLVVQTQDAQIFTEDVRRHIFETAEANPSVMQWVVGQIDDAQEPDAVLKELAQGKGDAAGRVFDRSFNLLNEDGRDALLALSLFAPSATRGALSAAAGFDDEGREREAVRNLNRLWLVKLLDEHRRLAVEGLTRSMAAARLSEDPRADEFRRRFIAYFIRFAEERDERTPENYDALEAERDNLLSAAETAFASEDWGSVTQMAYALAHPVEGMLSVRGYWNEAARLGEQALQAAHSLQDERKIADLSHNLAVTYQDRGEPTKARRLYDESLEIEKRLGNQRGGALTVWGLGNISLNQGYFDEARKLFQEALETFRRLGDQANTAGVLHQLGSLAQDQGEDVEARRLYGESLEISKRLGNQIVVASTLHELGRLAQNQGELEEARCLYNESLKIKKRLGNQDGIAITLGQLGILAEDEGEKAEAARLFREALSIFERLGSPYAKLARRDLARVEGEAS
jgi:tetratricopeptide (TPR) repeat protein